MSKIREVYSLYGFEAVETPFVDIGDLRDGLGVLGSVGGPLSRLSGAYRASLVRAAFSLESCHEELQTVVPVPAPMTRPNAGDWRSGSGLRPGGG